MHIYENIIHNACVRFDADNGEDEYNVGWLDAPARYGAIVKFKRNLKQIPISRCLVVIVLIRNIFYIIL